MKKILLIISYLAIIGCQSKQEIKSHVNNKESIRLTKKAMKIVFLKENEIEKVDSAIMLLKKAINIDPKYIEPRLNLIRLLINKKSYSAALSNCRDLQKNYPNSPIYLIIEGFVYEKCNNNKLATTKYRKALEQ